jgi:hypothetical protein
MNSDLTGLLWSNHQRFDICEHFETLLDLLQEWYLVWEKTPQRMESEFLSKDCLSWSLNETSYSYEVELAPSSKRCSFRHHWFVSWEWVIKDSTCCPRLLWEYLTSLESKHQTTRSRSNRTTWTRSTCSISTKGRTAKEVIIVMKCSLEFGCLNLRWKGENHCCWTKRLWVILVWSWSECVYCLLSSLLVIRVRKRKLR